jgi:hypothetical protein
MVSDLSSIRGSDPNPCGNSRGGRGITILDHNVYVTGYCTIRIFDHNLDNLGQSDHSLLAGLHEITADSATVD